MEITASIELKGESFSPAKASTLTGIRFSTTLEPGAISKVGLHVGHPSPFGRASIDASEQSCTGEKLLSVLNILRGKMHIIHDCGATEAFLYVGYFHDGQCNGVLSKEEIALLHELGIPMVFSTYDIGDETLRKVKTERD